MDFVLRSGQLIEKRSTFGSSICWNFL